MKIPELIRFIESACGTAIVDTLDSPEARIDQRKAWAVLSALRGPDMHRFDQHMKEATTGVIRWAIFRSMAAKDLYYGHGFIITPDSDESAKLRRSTSKLASQVGMHFVDHARLAFEALDLKWDEVNVIE